MTVLVFSLWIAGALLFSAGWGRTLLKPYAFPTWWGPVLMIVVSGCSLISNLFHPQAINFGSIIWSAAVVTVGIQYARMATVMWALNFSVFLGIARLIGPLNPSRVQIIAWLPWEAGVVGIMAALVGEDPLDAVLVGVGAEIGSSVMLSLYTGRLHWGTVRDLVFSLLVSLVAWMGAVVVRWWKQRKQGLLSKESPT
ncbi:MAG: hypothetical protein C7B44_05635 [Sulfobacillus thermosulfidooxidans]|uniref:Uncharacterized protein n=1 Tax=Sulfobacillus thermotolerans TaxID=338644 RepID=A0ABN5H205_9FIRM|nr:hypothetical protein BXT84_06615 [Sulfobacillus thermotolerans]PSR37082.1 MAG: hypothetical protein C7B44_05635 [Sulfobacillus thermosulfidooxidans]